MNILGIYCVGWMKSMLFKIRIEKMNWHVEKKQQVSDEIGGKKNTHTHTQKGLAINLKNIDFEIHLDILKISQVKFSWDILYFNFWSSWQWSYMDMSDSHLEIICIIEKRREKSRLAWICCCNW